MVKAMQSVFDSDRDYIEWGELNDPLQMELERIAQLKMPGCLPPRRLRSSI
jgi:hypothetical protein